MTITRRKLLAAGAASTALAAVPHGTMAATGEMRTVPSSGVMIPAVGLGTWITFNVGEDPELLARSVEVMRAFFDEGGGMIDTSPMYGSAQATIGHGLERLGTPPSLFSADKIWTSSLSEGADQLAKAGRHWGVNAFNLMQVHNLVAAEGHLEALFQHKAAGKIGHVGLTTSHGRRHADLERLMQTHPIDFVQLTYNVLDREAEDRLLPLARERGIAVIVNRPFQRGALIDRTRNVPLPELANDLGAGSWAELMLKFILSHPAVTVAIPATTRVDHVRQNKAAARGLLPDDTLREQIAARVAML